MQPQPKPYRVETATGAVVYSGSDLHAAIEAAETPNAVPYVISKKGRRPVVDTCLGRFGESVEDLRARIYN